jgi:hypothetical protein
MYKKFKTVLIKLLVHGGMLTYLENIKSLQYPDVNLASNSAAGNLINYWRINQCHFNKI